MIFFISFKKERQKSCRQKNNKGMVFMHATAVIIQYSLMILSAKMGKFLSSLSVYLITKKVMNLKRNALIASGKCACIKRLSRIISYT